jgi:hypothetical protein
MIKQGHSEMIAVALRCRMEELVRGYLNRTSLGDLVTVEGFNQTWTAFDRHLDDVCFGFYAFEVAYCKQKRLPTLRKMAYELASTTLDPEVTQAVMTGLVRMINEHR